MRSLACCQNRSSLTRRFFAAAQWVVPGTILALLPKCPACLAAYVLLWTGVGLSMSAAGIVRTSLLVLSIAMLAYVLFRYLKFFFKEIHP
jgi:hypothetical protein